MKITFHGWRQSRKPDFRKDLLALIGAGTPSEATPLALAHAQAIARTFTVLTLCKRRGKPVSASTPEVEAFLRRPGILAYVDKVWNRALKEG